MIVKGMLLTLVSAALGLLAAAPLPKLFAATLQEFRVHSLAIYICVPLLLLFVVLAAIYVPESRDRDATPRCIPVPRRMPGSAAGKVHARSGMAEL